MTEEPAATGEFLPPGFKTKLAIVGVVYMFGMFALSQTLIGWRMGDMWFRTALPLTWIGAAALHWALTPVPRPTLADLRKRIATQFANRPGATIWWLGIGALIMGLALFRGSEMSEGDLRIVEVAAAGIAIAAVIGGVLLRPRRRAR